MLKNLSEFATVSFLDMKSFKALPSGGDIRRLRCLPDGTGKDSSFELILLSGKLHIHPRASITNHKAL